MVAFFDFFDFLSLLREKNMVIICSWWNGGGLVVMMKVWVWVWMRT